MVGRFETFRFDRFAVAGATADPLFAGIWPRMAGIRRQKAAFFVILVVIIDTIGRDRDHRVPEAAGSQDGPRGLRGCARACVERAWATALHGGAFHPHPRPPACIKKRGSSCSGPPESTRQDRVFTATPQPIHESGSVALRPLPRCRPCPHAERPPCGGVSNR